MSKNWDVPPGEIFQPWNPNIEHTPPPITSVDGPAQPIVTIPIVGPAPFNTLAIVRGRGWVGEGPISDGKMHHKTSIVSTHLKIPGFDPDRPVLDQVQHSTSATILTISSWVQRDLENDDGSEFTIAIDAVHPEAVISDDGRFAVAIDTANSHYQTSSADFLEMTSWVLYHDPKTKPLSERVYVDWEIVKNLHIEKKAKIPNKLRKPKRAGRDPKTGEWIELPNK